MMPTLLANLRALKESGIPVRRDAAERCVADLMKTEDLNEGFTLESVDLNGGDSTILGAPPVLTFPSVPPMCSRSSETGTCTNGGASASSAKSSVGLQEIASRAKATVNKLLDQMPMAPPLMTYVEAVVVSACLEARSPESAAEATASELKCFLSESDEGWSLPLGFFDPALYLTILDGSEAMCRKFSKELDANVLIRKENIMLMWGGGNQLLKDTDFEMLRGRRYGIVGRNGAGKTTLMGQVASGAIEGMDKSLKLLYVRPEVLVEANEMKAIEFCKGQLKGFSQSQIQESLEHVGFPSEMQQKAVSELSGGWRIRLLLANAMMNKSDVLLLDEPTNHLDVDAVAWLSDYLLSLNHSSMMVISHDANFLDRVCTDIIYYTHDQKLQYHHGNFSDFRKSCIISDAEAEILLKGDSVMVEALVTDEVAASNLHSFVPPARTEGMASAQDLNGTSSSRRMEAAAADDDASEKLDAVSAGLLDKKSRIAFPIPGKLVGHTASKAILECKNVCFAYEVGDNGEASGNLVLEHVNAKVLLTSRIAMTGVNGAGKSTLLNLLCGEINPTKNPKDGSLGECYKHRNLRLAYIAQEHMYHLHEFLSVTPVAYMQRRFRNGWDEALQERLLQPNSEEEAKRIKELAAKYGKYGNEVESLNGRQMRPDGLYYEVRWKNLDDEKQNTYEPLWKLKLMGVEKFTKALDERLSAHMAGVDQRPLTQREIVKHLEQFGLDEDQIINRTIESFSAGQKSKLTLGAAFWAKPHMIALDEPTNYIDMETLDSLAKALIKFRGAVVVVSHSSEFISKVCSENWHIENGAVVTSKLKN